MRKGNTLISVSSPRLRDKVPDSFQNLPCFEPAHERNPGSKKESVHAYPAESFGKFRIRVVVKCYDSEDKKEKT